MTIDVEAELDRLARALHAERLGARARFREERRLLTLAQRVERGLALRDLAVTDTDAAPGGRTILWLAPRDGEMRDLRIGQGDPVLLWQDDPEGPDVVRAIVSRRRSDALAVAIDGEVPEWLWTEGFRLDREAPEVTFDRGARAIERAKHAKKGSDEAKSVATLLGARAPDFDAKSLELEAFDEALEDDQRVAVQRALAARDLSLVLGPPGTGKTRTLTELVRQAVARGERVLVTAASHTAVDNLAERLVDAGENVVRIGHPARVSPAMEERTLDALLEKTDAWKLARRWTREAEDLRRRTLNRTQRGTLRGEEKRAAWSEVRQLMRDAREYLKDAQRTILSRARVIAATAAGADAWLLEHEAFDRVVLDEATQAPDPIALVALLRAPKATLAGDPHQLPPTVIAREALDLGLGSTFFERIAATQSDARVVTTLRVQHRMHEALMAFPNDATYGAVLITAEDVRTARLEELPGIEPDPSREGPFVLVDTAGRGWEEVREADDPSTRNPGNAERIADEVRRLIARGVAPSDVGVITPYHAQVRLLRDALEPELAAGLEIATVDSFQGREKLAIVVDLVRSNDEAQLGFLEDVRRTNVAVTRARRFLLVLGDAATLARHPYYAALVHHAEHTGAWLSAWSE
ncbi:AAA domain-containing protein [Sandaracinus amylolyticus]|uniref:Superfamily I DNA/RNA helicase n=1 Tax=Sandaracinus amylolyticus TaxID=927083 RepID=A0A0F6YHM7_9BACT|nr:AAA domain-containing protein [Sandaracinus amylolyticus]AKF04870.1 Superfamily I DNA/RNA helicase [Sandaracinus amylolyticus]